MENQIESFDYYAQELLIQKGMPLESFDNADYYRMQQVMQARSEDERPEDPMEMLQRLGLAPGGDM